MDTSPAAVEASIRRLGGKPLLLGGVATFAFVDTADPSLPFGGGALTSSERTSGLVPGARVLTVAAGLVAPEPGAAFLLDGEAGGVMASRPDRDPAFMLLLVTEWTHEVTIYRPHLTLQGDRGRRRETFEPVAAGVPAFLVETSGDVQEEAEGQLVRVNATLMVPAATPVQAMDGVLVTAGAGHPRWRVQATISGGPDWNTAVPLIRTDEAFT